MPTTTTTTRTVQPGGGTQVVVTKRETHTTSGVHVVQGQRDWSTGLFACMDDCKSCICGLCCMPCTLCRIAIAQGEFCGVPCCVDGGILAMRVKMRMEFGIKGSICSDFLHLCCCGACAVCQMEREMKRMGRMS